MSQVWRESKTIVIDVGTTLATTDQIEMESFAGGSIHVPSAGGVTELTAYGQLNGQAWGIAHDEHDDPIVFPVTAGVPKALPRALWHFPTIKLVATAGAATANVAIFLKS